MSGMGEDLERGETIWDDILIYGKVKSEHNERLRKAFERIKQTEIRLNKEKYEFRKGRIEYFGHTITKDR